MNNGKQSFEIDLLPVISLLAVIISFLLLTSVWVHIGSLGISQAIGTESDKKVQPTLSVTFEKNGLSFQVKDSDKISKRPYFLNSKRKKVRWNKVESFTANVIKKEPTLKMALILPAASSNYQDIIKMIDTFKAQGIVDVGIAPL